MRTSVNETRIPSPVTILTLARLSTIQNEAHAANHPSAEAIEPTSVTGTSKASPRKRPAMDPAVTPRTATCGVWNRSCTEPKLAGTVLRRPNANSNRVDAAKFPLKHWNRPSIAMLKIRMPGQRALNAFSNAIAVAKRLPYRLCHGAT